MYLICVFWTFNKVLLPFTVIFGSRVGLFLQLWHLSGGCEQGEALASPGASLGQVGVQAGVVAQAPLMQRQRPCLPD